tara:strand:+ start:806 stop:1063 length:258 start_codon:yes stop_codon:yes gene_type:complete
MVVSPVSMFVGMELSASFITAVIAAPVRIDVEAATSAVSLAAIRANGPVALNNSCLPPDGRNDGEIESRKPLHAGSASGNVKGNV